MTTFRTMLAAPICALTLAASAPAGTTLVNHADGSFSDTATGYTWRTLDQYDGLDFAAAAAALPAGYQVASAAQLAQLTADAPADPMQFGATLAAMGADSANGIVWGFYGDGTRYLWLAAGDTAWNSNADCAYGWTNWNYAVPAGTSFAGLSLFAVDTGGGGTVPEPGGLALVALGLAALFRAGRTRRVAVPRRPAQSRLYKSLPAAAAVSIDAAFMQRE